MEWESWAPSHRVAVTTGWTKGVKGSFIHVWIQQFRDPSPHSLSSRPHGHCHKPKGIGSLSFLKNGISRSTDMLISHSLLPPQTSPFILSPRELHGKEVMKSRVGEKTSPMSFMDLMQLPYTTFISIGIWNLSFPNHCGVHCIPLGGMKASSYLQNIIAQRGTEEAHV